MPYRKEAFVGGEYYHVFNQGVEKRPIFRDDRDRKRFLRTIHHYQLAEPNGKLSQSKFSTPIDSFAPRRIHLVSYCLMGNHYHLLLSPTEFDVLSKYMAEVINSYTKYFNKRHDRVGPLFRGPFKAIRVTTNEQLLHLSRYIHLNPFVAGLIRVLEAYPWSSYPVYLGKSIDPFLEPEIVMDQLETGFAYRDFVMDRADYARSLELLQPIV